MYNSPQSPPHPLDRSRTFRALVADPGPILSADEIHRLGTRYQFLLIKGFLGDLLPHRFDGYFADIMHWLEVNGIKYRRLEPATGFSTQKLCSNNVDPITEAVEQMKALHPDRTVMVISHSKGGIDTLEALCSRDQLRSESIGGWIPLQAPFYGTPVADWATGNPLANPVIEFLLSQVFGGDATVARSMCVADRESYMDQRAQDIRRVQSEIPIVCLASTITPEDHSVFAPLRFLIDRISKLPNDGLLPEHSEIIRVDGEPVCAFVCADSMDHIYPVIRMEPPLGRDPDAHKVNRRERVFLSLLKIWLQLVG